MPVDHTEVSPFPSLPTGWECKPLGELVESVRGISYGVVQPGKPDPSGVPIVRVNNIKFGRINTDDVLSISKVVEENYGRTRLKGNEVLLTLVGTLGECAVVPVDLRGWNVARAVGVIPVASPIDPKWVEICLRTSHLQHLMRAWATTTVQATLNLRDVAKLPVPLPPKPIREAITKVLSGLEDKIELNRRTNETLEAMARTLFRSWFVDFDPVRAKADGQKPQGMDAATAKLFPDSFEPSVLGPIPKGWRVDRLDRLVTSSVRRVDPGFSTVSKPYVPIECIDTRSLTLSRWLPGTDAQSSLISFEPGDIVFGAMRPYFHKVCVAPFAGTTRTTAFVLRSHPDELAFSACVLSSDDTISFATTHSEGSTIPYAKWGNSLDRMPVCLPPIELRRAFHHRVWPLLQKCVANVNESQALAATRDALLPKLLSGEVSVV